MYTVHPLKRKHSETQTNISPFELFISGHDGMVERLPDGQQSHHVKHHGTPAPLTAYHRPQPANSLLVSAMDISSQQYPEAHLFVSLLAALAITIFGMASFAALN